MTQLSDLKDAVAALTAEAQDAAAKNGVLLAKVDALIELTDTIKGQLVAIAENGQLPSDVLSTLTTAINDSVAAIHAIGTATTDEAGKVDAATTRDATDSPAPAPEPAPSPEPAPLEPDPVDPPVESPPETP